MAKGGRDQSERDSRVEAALELESSGNLRAAHEAFKRLLKASPSEEEALTLRYLAARTSVASGTAALRAARGHLRKALASVRGGVHASFPLAGERHPLTEALLLNLDGFMLFQLRREREALRQFRQVLSSMPEAPGSFSDRYARAQAWHNLALCCVKLRRPEEAHGAFRRALEGYSELELSHPVARVADGLGQLLGAMGKFREARVFLEASIEIKRRMGDLRGQSISYGALSRTALRCGDLPGATAYAERVIALSQKLRDGRGLVAGLIYRGDSRVRRAQGLLERAGMLPRGMRSVTRRATSALLTAREDYLTAAVMSPDPVYRLNCSVGLCHVHHWLGAQQAFRKELALAGRLYEEMGAVYPEIEESLRELEALSSAAAGETAPLLRLAGHVREAVENQRMTLELQSAKTFQSKILPAGGTEVAGARVEVLFEPCTETSGDFYDFFETEEGGFAALGDVTGHGAGAAMLMSPVVVALREAPPGGDAASRLAYANDVVARHAPRGQFVTLAAAAWERGGGQVRILSAGHDWPIVLRAGGGVETLDRPQDPALGLSQGEVYTPREVALGPGDRVLLYSDGLSETRNAGGELFEPSMRDEIARLAKKKLDPAGFLKALAARADRFRGRRPSEDDRTMLLLAWPP